MTLEANGNLLVGTTTDNGARLQVSGSGTFSGQLRVETASSPAINIVKNATVDNRYIRFTNSEALSKDWDILNRPNANGNELAFYNNTDAVFALRLTPTGAATFSSLAGSGSRTVTADASGTLSASSDSSLKKEDKEYKIQGLSEILQLQPRAYKWLNDIEIRGEEATTEIGFFADEVNLIIPSAAPKGNDGLYGFYDRAVIAALVNSIKELKAENDTLKEILQRNNIK
jgi:hypothetical protein